MPERARLGEQLQQLYLDGKFSELLAQVNACLPKDAAGTFIAEKEKSDVVHDFLAHLAERVLEMNKQKLARRSGVSWAGWRATWGQRLKTSR